jgi:hypothetical protein
VQKYLKKVPGGEKFQLCCSLLALLAACTFVDGCPHHFLEYIVTHLAPQLVK